MTDRKDSEQGGERTTLPGNEGENEHLSAVSEIQIRGVLLEDDVKCGYFGIKPDWLQMFNNPKCLLVCLCCFATVQGFIVSGINNVNTSTIERRFQLPSSRVGMISSAYDVSAAVLGLIISFYGSGKNKPRLIAMATVAMALGSFIMILPHITTNTYHWGEESGDTCGAPETVQECSSENESGPASNLYWFILGQVFHGFGGTTLFTIGISVLDDSVPATSSPMYLGILYSFATLGPALGYLIGGQFLNIYVDFDMSESHGGNLTPEDPRWVGAWWLGYIFASILSLLIAIPISAFGKELPSASSVRKTRISQAYTHNKEEKDPGDSSSRSIRDLPYMVLQLLRNPIFMLLTFAGSVEGLSTSGFATFLPKLIQNQFGLSAAQASMYGGLVAVPGAAAGQLIGGLICKKCKLNVRGMLRFMMIVCLAAIILDAVVWIRCDQEDIAGVTHQYINTSTTLPNLNSLCNNNCSCGTEYYRPICSHQSGQYFSPCHAGCISTNSDKTIYYNCSCIPAPDTNTSTHIATSGRCSEGCHLIYVFLPLLLFGIFSRFLLIPPAVSTTLRCIHENQKTFGLGLQLFIARLVGTVPGPVLFGAIIDSTCLIWQEKCGENSSCWIYDNGLLSRNFFVILVAVKTCTSILFILAYKIYKTPKIKCDISNSQNGVEVCATGNDVKNQNETEAIAKTNSDVVL